MKALTEDTIRMAFVNCSKGEATRIRIPNPENVPWRDLDFLGWQDTSGSHRAHLVVQRSGGEVGLVLRQSIRSAGLARRSTMCQRCITPHARDGVAMTAADATRHYRRHPEWPHTCRTHPTQRNE